MKVNYNESNYQRTRLDTSTFLGSMHTFDPKLGCDSLTFQPCSDKVLSNIKAVLDSFRWYHINKDIPVGTAIAAGRYAEDVYYGGNPWYLNTLATAELLYDSLYVWEHQGFIHVTDLSKGFFQELVPHVKSHKYKHGSREFKELIKAVKKYADGFVEVVAKYTPADGSFAEQYSRDNGTALSAPHLTWSYAAFLTSTARREGVMPPSWADDSVSSIPEECLPNAVEGTYTSATATVFPPSQTPTV